MSLHTLPLEVLSIILRSTTSPKDLHALISASSRCLRAFNLSPTSTLVASLTNSIHPAAIYDAYAVAHAPTGPAAQDIDRVRASIGRYFNGNLDGFPLDRAILVSMCRLDRQITALATKYVQLAHESMVKVASAPTAPGKACTIEPEGDPTIWPPLSTAEYGRFQRAFYRYELYCRLYAAQPPVRVRELGHREQWNGFICHFRPWEVEELLCVYHFLCRIVEQRVKDLNDEVVDAVTAAPGTEFPDVPRTRPYPPPPSESYTPTPSIRARHSDTRIRARDNSKEMVLFQDLERWGLDLLGNEDHRLNPSTFTAAWAARGLGYMHQLIVAPRAQRMRLLRANRPTPRMFLRSALNYGTRIMPVTYKGEAEPQDLGQSDSDDHWYGTFGYRLFDPHSGKRQTKPLITDDLLRDFAFVFWDRQRIDIPWVSAVMHRAKLTHPQEVASIFRVERGESALRRLRGVRLRATEFSRIAEEFGRLREEDDDERQGTRGMSWWEW